METEKGCPFFAPGDVRHQVDAAVTGLLQALLPFAGHRLQGPALGLGDLLQQFAENSRQVPVGAQQQFGLVGIDADAHRLGAGRPAQQQGRGKQQKAQQVCGRVNRQRSGIGHGKSPLRLVTTLAQDVWQQR